jgi:hypothetical protein
MNFGVNCLKVLIDADVEKKLMEEILNAGKKIFVEVPE